MDLAEAISQAPWFPTRRGAPGGVGGLPDVCLCPCLLAGARITGHRLPLSYPLTGSSNSRHPMRPVPQRNKCLLPGGQAGWGRESAGAQLWISGGWKVHQSTKQTRGASSCPQGEQIIISPNVGKLPLLPQRRQIWAESEVPAAAQGVFRKAQLKR